MFEKLQLIATVTGAVVNVSLNFLIKNTLPIVLVEFVKILESKVLKALLIFSSLAFIL